MKIFLDTADVSLISRAATTGLVRGVTTNPSHILKSGKSFESVVKEICGLVPDHVSAEAVAASARELVLEATRIAAIDPKVVVKVPMTKEGIQAVQELEPMGIKTNVTMIFSPTQAMLAMSAGASFVSIVLSRLEKAGQEVNGFIEDTMLIKENYGFSSEVIAGSVKTQPTLLICLRNGVDIATIPGALFDDMFGHPLTESGLEQFDRDWQKLNGEIVA